MDTGDPTNLFSNLLVLYAMYMISYTDQANKYKSWFIKSIRTIVFIMGLICFAGWLDILTVKEFNEQYYIVFSENMRLGDFHLLNIHAFMIIIGLKMAIISTFEWVLGIEKGAKDSEGAIQRTKGA